MWSERCALDTGVWQLKFRDDLPGFDLMVDDDDTGTVLQVFTKPADSGHLGDHAEAPASAGTFPDATNAVFAPAATTTATSRRHAIVLRDRCRRAARKAAYDATPADEVPEPPCGDYGMTRTASRYFLSDSAHPDKVVYLEPRPGRDDVRPRDADVRVGASDASACPSISSRRSSTCSHSSSASVRSARVIGERHGGLGEGGRVLAVEVGGGELVFEAAELGGELLDAEPAASSGRAGRRR